MIHIHSFVRRQTASSPFTSWTVKDEELISRIKAGLPNAEPGYRDGIVLVPINPEGFFSAVVALDGSQELTAEFKARVPGEDPRKVIRGKGCKQPAKTVWAVLYRDYVLAEKNENESNEMWELISINASPSVDEKPAPMPPETLIANHFELSGGTATKMSDSDFVKALRESVMYWKDKVMVEPA